MEQLTQKRLKELYTYRPTTGIFTRKSNGKTANNIHNGYVRIFIDYKEYRAHRLAYLYMTGKMPQSAVDHINQDKSDNRWDNLRIVDHQKNARNLPRYTNNKSGSTGVYFHKRDKQWIAFIHVNGKKIHLGCFENQNDAKNARIAANDQFDFHSNHGQHKMAV